MLAFCASFAQSGTNSPYSQYGLGALSEQGSGASRGMNGVGIAFQDHDRSNYLNPASYSGIDSLTFLFDVGMSLQVTNFAENGVRRNANNADFDYAVGSFRAIKNLGMSFGILSVAKTGYNYSSTSPMTWDPTNSGITTSSMSSTYKGNGGVHKLFIGAGYTPLKGLSIGANIGYLWGSTSKTITTAYTESYATTLMKTYDYTVGSYALDLGLQYGLNITKKDYVRIGATYSLGHDLNSDPEMNIISGDTTSLKAVNALELPTSIGIGIAYQHTSKLKIGFDYTLDKWSDVKYPVFIGGTNGNVGEYAAAKGLFSDRKKYNIGAEYCQNDKGRTFLSRICYRGGVSYTTPYLKINGAEGPKEYAASLGLGIPIVNGYLSASRHFPVVNISAQWAHCTMPNAITENTFRINVGITFSERWFAKWKFD